MDVSNDMDASLTQNRTAVYIGILEASMGRGCGLAINSWDFRKDSGGRRLDMANP
jgi:hypothetical protein